MLELRWLGNQYAAEFRWHLYEWSFNHYDTSAVCLV